MPAASEPMLDLIDLKFLPAWVREEEGAAPYADFEGEDPGSAPDRRRHFDRDRGDRGPRRDRPPRGREERGGGRKTQRGPGDRRGAGESGPRGRDDRRPSMPGARMEAPVTLPGLTVRFLPEEAALENVMAQIKEGTAAFSVYALARLFLQKPERYDVRVAAAEDQAPIFRLGEAGPVSMDRGVLESAAFRTLRDQFYQSEVTTAEPVKGNFTSVARERTTGTLLGPTNYHGYQPQLRKLYEQRFRRRLSFPEFQRQIEIVADPALVEQWKEEVRKSTSFTTRDAETPLTFTSETEAERHFRDNHLSNQIQETREAVIDGVTSRNLRDRGIARLIENFWASEVRSPSNMMQELTAKFRTGGLHIFRHRRGMLFVSPIRPKAIEEGAVSESVRRILELIKETPRIRRKDLADKLIAPETNPDESSKARMALASDLRFLVREGHVVEFNDGTLDSPRVKPPKPEGDAAAPAPAAVAESAHVEPAAVAPGENTDNHSPTTLSEGSTPS